MAEPVTKYKTFRGELFDTLEEAEAQERADVMVDTFLNASQLHMSRPAVERGMKAVLKVYDFTLRPVPEPIGVPPLPPRPMPLRREPE